MNSRSNIRVLAFLQTYVKAAAILSFGVGLIVIAGWIFDIEFLKSILPDAATMKFNTALGFLCAGLALWFVCNEESQPGDKRIGQGFAGLVLLIGLLTIAEYLFGWNLGVDQLFVKDLATAPDVFPGRMSQITAICFTFNALALLLISSRLFQYFAVGTLTLSLLALIGYLFDYRSLYQLPGYGSVAIHTAFTFLILSVGILATRPERGPMKLITSQATAGRTVRFVLPMTVVLIILLGLLVEQGEQLGLFDSNDESIILVVLLILIYSPLIYFYANRITQAEEKIMRLNRLYATLSQINQTIVRIKDRDELYQSICDVAVQFGEFSLACIGLLDEATGHIKPVAAHGSDVMHWPFPIVNIHEGPLKDGLIATAIRTSRVMTSEDIQADNRLQDLYDLVQEYPYHSSAAIPFRSRERTIGVLSLVSSEAGLFKAEEELGLLEEMGLDISFALNTIEIEAERKRTEAEILSISRFPDENPNPVLRVTKDEKIVYANRASAGFLKTWQREIGQIIPEKWHADVKQAFESGINTEIEIESLGRVFSCILSPIQNAGYINMYCYDITERKQAQGQLKRQLDRLKALRAVDLAISTSFDMQITLEILLQQVISQLNVDAADILLFDPRREKLEYASSLGFRSNAIQHTQLKLGEGYAGHAVLERQTIHIPDLPQTAGKLARAPQLEHESFVDYYGAPLIVKGEVKGVLEIYHRSPLNPESDWLEFLETLARQAAIAIDSAQLFQSLQRANAELEQRVTERTAELNQLNLELQHANRAKDEFLATMSHELRTPLNSILGLSESLLEQRRGPLNEEQQKSLRIVESSGHHLLELINDVLDLSKIEAGKLDFYPEVIAADEISQSSLAFIRSQAAKKSITIAYERDEAVNKIYADPRRLKQILVNLLSNAVKFTPDHGQVTLQVLGDAEQDLLQFSVIDTGIGIAPEDLERLFQPFVQVDSRLNRQFEGTGLGLALIRKLTDLHGGSVHVESAVAQGSRFTINLPWGRKVIAEQESSESGGEAWTDEQSGESNIPPDTDHQRGTILLAEDNLANVLTIGEYLESFGYEMVIAHDGLEAVEKAREINPDLILMDIQMPTLDGLEAMRRLRAESRFETTPIIALTALAMSGDRERCLQAGANEYMSKPVSLKRLLKTIRKLLRQEK